MILFAKMKYVRKNSIYKSKEHTLILNNLKFSILDGLLTFLLNVLRCNTSTAKRVT